MSFSSCGVAADVCARLAERGLTEPFPIQSATLPDALAGRDVCGRAPTGSGKTLAFGLAVAARVSKARPKHPQALILVPTRELAAQVQAELTALLRRDQGAAISVYGGVGYGAQRKGLTRGASVVVACPGRLEDLIAQRAVFLDEVTTVVVDEADRMADMGFLPAVRRLLDQTSSDRQTLLFSATLDGEVDALVRRYQHDPVRHEVEGSDDELGDVEHLFLPTKRDDRPARTAALVAKHGRSVVFCRTRRGADRLVKQLATAGVTAAALHGSRSQNQREQALASFAQGRIPAIVATDVMARGIHVDDVACVVHFDPPGDTKAYIHRSGRTGRAGASGVVVSLVEKSDEPAVRAIRRELGLTSTDRPRPAGPRDTRPQPHSGAGGAAGTVKFFRADKGFGFITREQGEDVFVHLSNIRTRGGRPLREGQRVEFELGRGRKGVEARNVRVVA